MRRFDWKWVIIGACVALAVYIGVIPLGFLLWQSFRTPQTAATAGRLHARQLPRRLRQRRDAAALFWNSLQFASGTAVLAFVLGTALAWMNERTNTPFKSLFFALSLIPLVIPGILFTVAWILLGEPADRHHQPRAAGRWFGTDAVFVNVYSLAGMIWVDGLHYSPMAFLLMTRGVPRHGSRARGVGDDERRRASSRWCGASRCG